MMSNEELDAAIEQVKVQTQKLPPRGMGVTDRYHLQATLGDEILRCYLVRTHSEWNVRWVYQHMELSKQSIVLTAALLATADGIAYPEYNGDYQI